MHSAHAGFSTNKSDDSEKCLYFVLAGGCWEKFVRVYPRFVHCHLSSICSNIRLLVENDDYYGIAFAGVGLSE